MSDGKTKVFVFQNSGKGTDWINGCAIDEHGRCPAQHISSSYEWFRYDMGLTGEGPHWKAYEKAYPNGFELIEVEDPLTHEWLSKAYKLNQKLGEKARQKEASNG